MKRITTTLLLFAAFLGSAQEVTFLQSFPTETISIRLTKNHGNWQHRITEVSNKGGLMLGGVGYQINGMLQFTPAIDLIAFTNGADIRFEAMLGRKSKSGTINIFAQHYIAQKGLIYGFGATISIPQY